MSDRRWLVLAAAIGAAGVVAGLARPPAIGALGMGLVQAAAGHVALVFPDGRPRSRLQGLAIVAAYLIFPPVGLAPPALAALAGVAVSAVVLALMLHRWLASSDVLRRILAPVLSAAAAALVLLAFRDPAGSPPLLGVGALALPAGVLVGLLRTRLDRAAVAGLVTELGGATGRPGLEQALARSMHDPSLTLALWLREPGRFVDTRGRPMRLPSPESGRAVTELRSGDERVAALVHDPALSHDPELIAASATTARLAIENERFQAEILSRLDDVRASRVRMVEAADAERRRIERNLHDGAQQQLVTLSLSLTLMRARLGQDHDPQLERCLEDAACELGAAIEELRELAHGIHPAVLSEAGLRPALESLARRLPLPVTVSSVPSQRLAATVEATLYFALAEALANAARHADASSATVRVDLVGDRAVGEVADDGAGGADPARGSGLQGIADRVAAVDGQMELASPAGGGTRVRVVIPIGRSPAGLGED